MHPIVVAENGRKRTFVQKEPYIFGVFSIKPPVTTEPLVVI